MERPMTRRDALIRVIDCLHAEIAALKANDIVALERATRDKLTGIEAVAANDDDAPPSADVRELAEEANRLNETCRLYVNLKIGRAPVLTPVTNAPLVCRLLLE